MTKLPVNNDIVSLPTKHLHQDPLRQNMLDYSSDESQGEEGDESEDDFAREMDDEIQNTMPFSLKKKYVPKEVPKTVAEEQFYDDVYFNSSDDEEGENKQNKRKVIPDEELFYDPLQDDDDEKWINNKRKNYLKSESSKEEPVDPSAAVLCCPACMTVLCRDCQQHETHKEQFRAMFVFNCLVCTDEVLTYKEKMSQRQRKKLKNLTTTDTKQQDTEETYHPVKCSVCQTKVAVYDKDEVYHFFNILTTHS